MSTHTITHQPIHELSDILISRIAAGEVIERPGSVVKELVENSLDAGSKSIVIKIQSGGRSLISVQDDGSGIPESELSLAFKRHATSKISGNNLLEISSLGFRGEGLASIASVSKASLISKHKDSENAYQIKVIGGEVGDSSIASLSKGTIVTVRDLFYATPARLKFLKTERSENIYIADLVKKFALANQNVEFKLIINDKEIACYKAGGFKDRLSAVLGKEFINNSIKLSYKQEEYEFNGYISLPTYNRANSNLQYSFINSRLVKDKIIFNALKVAYQDYLARDRYPVCVLFIKLPYHEVDVNVHPAKSEVRFRDSQKIRNMLIAALKETLAKGAFKSAPEITQKTLSSFQVEPGDIRDLACDTREANIGADGRFKSSSSRHYESAPPGHCEPKAWQSHPVSVHTQKPSRLEVNRAINLAMPEEQGNLSFTKQEFAPLHEDLTVHINQEYIDYPLGSAIAQLHKTYIISQTKDGLIIIDQHAAHERLVYEQLKLSLKNKNPKTQKHLFSEIVELEAENLDAILNSQEKLKEFGVIIEKFGAREVIIKETPEIFEEIDIKRFIKDLSDNIVTYDEALNLEEKFTEIYGNHACRNSIRAGRKLNIIEMNQILRNMEQTPFSGQCNHGRPTYVKLKKTDLEKLFGRA